MAMQPDFPRQPTVFSEKCSQNVRNTGPDGPDPWSRLGDLNPGPTHYEIMSEDYFTLNDSAPYTRRRLGQA